MFVTIAKAIYFYAHPDNYTMKEMQRIAHCISMVRKHNAHEVIIETYRTKQI